MLTWRPDGGAFGLVGPIPPPANTPIGSFGENCAAAFFGEPIPPFDSPPADSPPAAPRAAPIPAGGPGIDIFVTTNDDEDDGDRSPGDISLREAVLIANEADGPPTIFVPAGEYFLSIAGRGEEEGLVGDLDLKNLTYSVRIVGADRAATAIRAAADDRVFQVHSGANVEITHLTIQDGISTTGGGVMNAGTLYLSDVAIRANIASEDGGGLYNAPNASLGVSSSIIQQNAAQFGGGVAIAPNSVATFFETVIDNNGSDSGGGLFNRGGVVEMESSAITNNLADESGAGVINLSTGQHANLSLINTEIGQNRITTQPFRPALAQGAGICNAAANEDASAIVTMYGGTVSGNFALAGDLEMSQDAAAQGGGIHNRAAGANAAATINLFDVDVTTNVAAALGLHDALAAGGGIYNRAENDNSIATVNVQGSDVTSNSATATIAELQAGDSKGRAVGGGIFNRARLNNAIASAVLTATNVDNNSAVAAGIDDAEIEASGGGIYNTSGDLATGTTFTPIAALSITAGGLLGNNLLVADGSPATLAGGGIANIGDYGRTIVDLADVTISQSRQTVDGMPGAILASGAGVYNRVNPLAAGSRFTMLRTSIRQSDVEIAQETAQPPRGGGMFTEGLAVEIRDSTIAGNDATQAGEGGGIFARQNLEIVNSTISGNAAASGAGLYVQTGSTTVRHSTVANNTASISGGGIAATAGPQLHNSIVAGNFVDNGDGPYAEDLSGAFASGGTYNFIGQGSASVGITDNVDGNRVGTAASPLAAMLGALADNGGPTETHLALPGSPVIDSGDPIFNPNDFSPALSSDQRLLERVVDGDVDEVPRIDIGAVEYSPYLFGDFNSDSAVDLLDLLVLARNINAAGHKTYSDGDLNGDATVNAADAALLLHVYAPPLPPPSPAESASAVVRFAASPRASALVKTRHRTRSPGEAVDAAITGDVGLRARPAAQVPRRSRSR